MPRAKRLLLHVGTHKTGTTSFQGNLIANRDALRAKGVRHLRDKVYRNGKPRKKMQPQHLTFGNIMVRDSLNITPRVMQRVVALDHAGRAARRERMAARIRDMPARDVLISTEILCFLRTPEERDDLRAFIAATGREAQCVLVFRNTDDWRASWEDQLRKYGDERYHRLTDWPEDQRINGSWYYDKGAISSFWSDFNTTEIDYGAHTDIVTAIYDGFGIDWSGFETGHRDNLRGQPPSLATPRTD